MSAILKVTFDSTGWELHPGTGDTNACWQTVTSDELVIRPLERPADFPALADVDQIRRFCRELLRKRKAAMISCDTVVGPSQTLVKTVYKYRTGRAMALGFGVSLLAPLSRWIVDLLIYGTEGNITGVREAMVINELLKTAGDSEKRQLADNQIPIEWRFERYQPQMRGDFTFVISDEEKYDPQFPDHPLSRVRRLARRAERFFAVTEEEERSGLRRSGVRGWAERFKGNLGFSTMPGSVANGAPRLLLNPLSVKPMTIEELNREFGPQIVSDALLVGVMGQLGEKPTFTKRQEICRQQMETALKQSLEQQQQAEAFRARVKQQAEELLAQLDPQSTPMFVLREPGACEYYTETDQHGGKRLPVFTTPAFVDDFLTERRLTCEPEEITVSQLCTAEEKRPSADIASISINLCPRCGEGAMLKREHRDDHEQLLRLYAATVAGKSLCVARELEAALQREDLQQRLAALKNIINHIDPGAPRVHQEIIQAAKAVGDAAALERSTAALLKYAPSAMA